MRKSFDEMVEEDLKQIKELAALFFTPRDIAVMLEHHDVEAFVRGCNTAGCKTYQAFQSGRLQAEVDLRTSVMKLAKSGSSPAQTMAMDLLNKSKIKLRD